MIEENEILNGQIISEDNVDSLLFGDDVLEGKLIASGSVVASMVAQKGAKGDKGDKGDTGNPGVPGADGQDGVSPIVETSKSGKVTTITITDAEGTKTATINDGEDGQNGQNGQDGQDGQDGADGYSPSASVSKVGKIATITITDKDGTTTAEIRDGEDGSGTGDMLKSTYDTDNNGIVDNAEKVNNHTVLSDVPADAVFTDTTYTAGTGISISAQNVISNTQTSAEWGNISGTLADQTDLNTALGNKIDKSSTTGLVKNDGTIDTTTYSTFSGSYNDLSNKPTIPTKISDLTNDSNFEVNTNKVTSINSSSTDTQYPSAKCVYDIISGFSGSSTNVIESENEPINLFDLTSGNETLKKGYNVIDYDDTYSTIYYYDTSSHTNSVSNFRAEGIYVNSAFSDASVNDILAIVKGLYTSSGGNGYVTFYKSNSTTISYDTISSSGTYLINGNQGISGVKTFFSVPKLYTGLTPLNDQDLSTKKYVDDGLSNKQATLVSGTNIKTINSTSLLGSGNIDVGANIPVQDTAPLNPSEDDLWIDTSEPEEMQETIQNSYSDSTTDTYSCDYINDKLGGLLNIFYPVGSYYETSDTSFNPNTAWGGTWVEDSPGRFTLATGVVQANTDNYFGALSGRSWNAGVGSKGGQDFASNPLSSNGWSQIQLRSTNQIQYNETAVGASNYWTANYKINGSSAGASSETGYYGAALGGKTDLGNNMPPYICVKRWHRTA